MGSRRSGLIFCRFNDCGFCLRGFHKNEPGTGTAGNSDE